MFEHQHNQKTLELDRWNLDQMFWHGSSNSLLIAIGCSWTRAWGHDPDEKFFLVKGYVEDSDFMINHSYVGILAKHLGFDSFLNMAIPGSNNQTQTMNLIEFLERNRNHFDNIFVLWGITSIYRWELYCARKNAPWSYMFAPNLVNEEFEEWKYFFSNHWDKEYEMSKLSQLILFVDSYLSRLNIPHLFFPVFQTFNKHNMLLHSLPNKSLFACDSHTNDMLSLMFEQENVDLAANPVEDFCASPNISDPRVAVLVENEWLSKKHEHPTKKAHRFIAEQLIKHREKYHE